MSENKYPDPKDLTDEQKEQLKALEKKLFKRALRNSARNCFILIGASVAIGVLNAKLIHSQAFMFAGAMANAFIFIRQIRLDFLEENAIIVEELSKIFK